MGNETHENLSSLTTVQQSMLVIHGLLCCVQRCLGSEEERSLSSDDGGGSEESGGKDGRKCPPVPCQPSLQPQHNLLYLFKTFLCHISNQTGSRNIKILRRR
ncbi:UNVERIFIED_CONTAM: hypothetical protein K2H54_061046 [Gekko kuhli]